MLSRSRKALFLLALTLTCFSAAVAQERQKRPLVLVVYADWCPYCQNLKPVLVLMNDRYRGKIRYVVLDVTSEATTAKAKEQARSLGVEKFFDRNFATTSLVVIKDPAGREVFRAVHDYDFKHYEAALDQLHVKPAE
jgi:thiol-disulfide isomerase/thioredoxin